MRSPLSTGLTAQTTEGKLRQGERGDAGSSASWWKKAPSSPLTTSPAGKLRRRTQSDGLIFDGFVIQVKGLLVWATLYPQEHCPHPHAPAHAHRDPAELGRGWCC